MTDLVPCPTCGAKKGEACQTQALYYHEERRQRVQVKWLARSGLELSFSEVRPPAASFSTTHREVALWLASYRDWNPALGAVTVDVARQVTYDGELVDQETRQIRVRPVTRWEAE